MDIRFCIQTLGNPAAARVTVEKKSLSLYVHVDKEKDQEEIQTKEINN